MMDFLTIYDRNIIASICKKVVPGVSGTEDRIDSVLYSLNPNVRKAWFFYLRKFGSKVAVMSDKKLKKSAYTSPLKEFLLPIRYAAFSDKITKIKPPIHIKKERWEQQIFDASIMPRRVECEYVVVGSGAGGASVAYKLASLGYAVIIVEEGNYHNRKTITGDPISAFKNLYRNYGFTFAWGRNPFPVWTGKAVGGTTVINSGTCVRTSDFILDEWASNGANSLKSNYINNYYNTVENILDVHMVDSQYIGGIGKLFMEAASKLDWKHGALPRNSTGCDGQARCCFGCPTGAKQSTNVSFIPKALNNGAQIFTNGKVTSVDMDNGIAKGVTVNTINGDIYIEATNGVILSCGSLMTPEVLKNSGINNPNVGKNLSVHPAISVFALHGSDICMTSCSVPQSYHVSEFAPDFMLEGASMLPPVAAMVMRSVGKEFSELMSNYDRLSMFGAMIRDSSRGRVIKNGHMIYSLNREDTIKIQKATLKLIELLNSSSKVIEIYPFIKGLHKVRGLKYSWYGSLKNKLNRLNTFTQKDITLSAYHPLGTCRMGNDPNNSVVDPNFKVWNTRNLYVVDGSVFPSSTGYNPQLTIMSMGLMAGDAIDSEN